MKVLIVSDTHRHNDNLATALKKAGKIDNYNPHYITVAELYKVLELAPEYLGLTQESAKIY